MTFAKWQQLKREFGQCTADLPMPRNTLQERMAAVIVDLLILRIKHRVRSGI